MVSSGDERLAAVVLGASNVSRGLARLAAAVRGRSPRPADLFVAAGHGRSYGANSRVWMRRLPSILWCGLWRALDRDERGRDGRRTVALVTDVGNDLLYGFTPAQVASWVEEAVVRLRDRGASVTLTRLPLEAIATVGAARYRLLRTLFVPGCPLSLDEVRAAVAELDGRLVDVATRRGASLVEQPGHWYGLDALHPRRRRLDTLWHTVCDSWRLPEPRRRRRATVGEWAALLTHGAEVRSLSRVARFTPQPVCRFPEGGTLSLY